MFQQVLDFTFEINLKPLFFLTSNLKHGAELSEWILIITIAGLKNKIDLKMLP